MERILVSDVMTRDPITVKPGANLLECSKKMVQKKVGSLLIVDKKRLVGFISQRDILWALIKKSKEDLSKIKAIVISPKKIAKIAPSCTIDEAISKMKRLKFKKLPVIHDNKLVGLITIKDILNFHPEFYPEIEEFAKIRDEQNKLKRIEKREQITEGICEECGNYDLLQKFNGTIICETCKNSSQ